MLTASGKAKSPLQRESKQIALISQSTGALQNAIEKDKFSSEI